MHLYQFWYTFRVLKVKNAEISAENLPKCPISTSYQRGGIKEEELESGVIFCRFIKFGPKDVLAPPDLDPIGPGLYTRGDKKSSKNLISKNTITRA